MVAARLRFSLRQDVWVDHMLWHSSVGFTTMTKHPNSWGQKAKEEAKNVQQKGWEAKAGRVEGTQRRKVSGWGGSHCQGRVKKGRWTWQLSCWKCKFDCQKLFWWHKSSNLVLKIAFGQISRLLAWGLQSKMDSIFLLSNELRGNKKVWAALLDMGVTWGLNIFILKCNAIGLEFFSVVK